MDCRTFRRRHLAFLDDTLPGIEMVQMERHMQECPACAGMDAAIRRSLLLLRNLPALEPSAELQGRVLARLANESRRRRFPDHHFRGPSVGVFAGTAASVVALGLVGAVLFGSFGPSDVPLPRLPAVTASRAGASFVSFDEVATPAFAASMSTGMPMWPALLLAEEGSVRFATAELEPVSFSPQPNR